MGTEGSNKNKLELYMWITPRRRFTFLDIREIKIHVYGKPLTSDSSWEFLKIENKKVKTVQNNSYG